MIVSSDNSGNLYAFYPDATSKGTDPGNAINPKHAHGCPAGSFVAALTVDSDQNAVSAKWEKTGDPLEMKDLHFTLEVGSGYAFKASNGLYLSMENGMLNEQPALYSVSLRPNTNEAFRMQIGKRVLAFNKAGDSTEFKPGSGFTTNFWGPGDTLGLPLYLYTKDGADAPITVNKTFLVQMIAKAEALKGNELYTKESHNALQAALDQAIVERDSTTSTPESVVSATNKLN